MLGFCFGHLIHRRSDSQLYGLQYKMSSVGWTKGKSEGEMEGIKIVGQTKSNGGTVSSTVGGEIILMFFESRRENGAFQMARLKKKRCKKIATSEVDYKGRQTKNKCIVQVHIFKGNAIT